MIKNRREAIKLLGGALGVLGAANLFANENSTNSVNFTGGEAQNSGASNSVNSEGQNSAPNSIKQNSAENSSGDSASLYLRPPGALAERGFRSSCIKCGQCVQVCPYHSIYLLDITHLFDIGTPVIDAKDRGCYLCGALPCVLACPSGALSHETNEPKKVKMGIAVIKNLNACLAYRGQVLKPDDLRLKPAKTEQERELNSALAAKEGKPCDLCASLCPYPQPLDAIAMIEAGAHFAPQIRSACVGCGACAELCPARIIEIIPRADYKSIYEGKQ